MKFRLYWKDGTTQVVSGEGLTAALATVKPPRPTKELEFYMPGDSLDYEFVMPITGNWVFRPGIKEKEMNE